MVDHAEDITPFGKTADVYYGSALHQGLLQEHFAPDIEESGCGIFLQLLVSEL
jgi:hypothetical protein